MEVSFWKDKYYSMVLVLQEDTIDLELENQLLSAERKLLVDSQRGRLLSYRQDKKREAVTINLPGVNIFVNSEFNTLPNNVHCLRCFVFGMI
jgi:hypothetical protein